MRADVHGDHPSSTPFCSECPTRWRTGNHRGLSGQDAITAPWGGRTRTCATFSVSSLSRSAR
jgi:hypothetical protein